MGSMNFRKLAALGIAAALSSGLAGCNHQAGGAGLPGLIGAALGQDHGKATLVGVWRQYANGQELGTARLDRFEDGTYAMTNLYQPPNAIHSRGLSDVYFDGRRWTFKSDWGNVIASFELELGPDGAFHGWSYRNGRRYERQRYVKVQGGAAAIPARSEAAPQAPASGAQGESLWKLAEREYPPSAYKRRPPLRSFPDWAVAAFVSRNAGDEGVYRVHMKKSGGGWSVACKEDWTDVQPYSAYAQRCPGIGMDTYKALLGKFAVVD